MKVYITEIKMNNEDKFTTLLDETYSTLEKAEKKMQDDGYERYPIESANGYVSFWKGTVSMLRIKEVEVR